MDRAVSGRSETVSEMMAAIEAVTEERIREAAQAVRPDTIYFLKGREA